MPDSKKSISPKEIQVQVPEKLRSGVYANLANVSVTPAEVVLNFIYFNPEDHPQGTLVSRVILSRNHTAEIAKILEEAVSVANEVNPQ